MSLKERLNIRRKRTSGEEFKPHRLKEIRRTIAQRTVITEKFKNQPEEVSNVYSTRKLNATVCVPRWIKLLL